MGYKNRMFKQQNPYRNNKSGRKQNFNMSPTDNSFAKSFYSNGYYNIDKEKARKLISRARERERSEKKYLALSQKVMPEEHQDEIHHESQNMQVQEYQRPFTTAHGKRTLTGNSSNAYDGNGRCATRKQRLRGLGEKAYSSDKNNNMRHKNGYYMSEKVSSIDTFGGKKYSQNHPVYHENDVKDLKIVDYFTGMNRLNRYIKKSKERFRKGNRAFLQTNKMKASMISPYKKSLLNVQEIFDFVQKQEKQEQSKSQEDNEAIMIEDRAVALKTPKMDEKQKWKIVMDYMRRNPRTLVDALPDPDDYINQTMYHPAYDQIIDQENKNINNSHANPYSRKNNDALTLNSQNKDSLDEDENANNIKIIQNPNRPRFKNSNSDQQENISQNQMAFTNIEPNISH